MINIDRTEIKIAKNLVRNLIDMVFEIDQFFLLNNDHTIAILDNNSKENISIKLINVGYKPSCINIDNVYLYIGYVNGTVEVLDKNNSYESIKITSPSDAGGPGDPHISYTILSISQYERKWFTYLPSTFNSVLQMDYD